MKKINIKNILSGCVSAFDFFICLFFVLIAFFTLFFNVSSNGYQLKQVLLSVTIGLIVLVMGGVLCRKGLNISLEKNYKRLLVIIFFALTLIQVYIISALSTAIGWDVGTVVQAAVDVNQPNVGWNQFYFSVYPNNRFLFFFYHFFLSLSGKYASWFLLCCLNIIAINISILLSFFVVKRVLNIQWGMVIVCFSILTYGMFGWIIVPYSDTLVMPFIVGIYLLSLLEKEQDNKQKKAILVLSMVVISFVGYLIKPTAIIIFIAVFLIRFLYLIINKSGFKWKLYLFVFLVGFGSLSLGWKTFVKVQNIIDIEDNKSMPITHFIMMGLNKETNGAFYGEDVEYTWQFDSTADKRNANTVVIKQRLEAMGIKGYVQLLGKKILLTFCEGDFFWGKEGDFAKYDFDHGNLFLKNLYYPDGDFHNIYLYYAQAVWLILLGLSGGAIAEKGNENYTLVHCALFGIVLFLLLFEMRSRYLIPFLPFFCIAAVFGLKSLMDIITKFELRKKAMK